MKKIVLILGVIAVTSDYCPAMNGIGIENAKIVAYKEHLKIILNSYNSDSNEAQMLSKLSQIVLDKEKENRYERMEESLKKICEYGDTLSFSEKYDLFGDALVLLDCSNSQYGLHTDEDNPLIQQWVRKLEKVTDNASPVGSEFFEEEDN